MSKFFADRAFYKRAICIALPVMGQMFIQSLVSLVDNFMVAGLGDIKMSGVNVMGQVNFLFIVFANAVCMSSGIFMSQYKGANDPKGMQNVFRFKVIFTGVAGIIYTVFCIIAPRGALSLMVSTNVDAAAIIDQTVQYSRAQALSMLFMCVSMAISTSLRDIEQPRPTFVISVIATCINTTFNFLLIYGNFGFPRLEVVGAGYATVIARFTEMVLFIGYVVHKKSPFLFKSSTIFAINHFLFRNIFKKSLMILYCEMSWSISETISIALFNTRGGAEVVSGLAAGFTIANLFMIACQASNTTTGVIIGQTLGANDLDTSIKYKNWLLVGSIIFGALFIILAFFASFLVPIVFGKLTLQAQDFAKGVIVVMASYLPAWAFLNVQYATLRAGGDTLNGVISDTVANTLFLGGMFALTFLTTLSPVVMYAIVKLSDVAKIIICAYGLHSRKWLVNLTMQTQ